MLESPYEQKVHRQEFQRDLLENVHSIQTVVNSLKEEVKAVNFAKTQTKKAELKQRYLKKRTEVETMISDVKEIIAQIGSHLASEQQMLAHDIQQHKVRLADVLGFGDEVKGFDQVTVDDSIDYLDIYAEFLGEEEYEKAKEGYIRALNMLE